MVNGDNVHSKGSESPRKRYEITVADTVDISSGRMEVIEMLNRSISKVKSTPAKGALKMPATAPAAPQPKRMVMFLYDRPIFLAMFEPMAAPVYTIGASAPTEPPKPMVTELARMDDHMLCGRILDSFFDTARSTFVTPCPILSLMTYLTKSIASSIPMPG